MKSFSTLILVFAIIGFSACSTVSVHTSKPAQSDVKMDRVLIIAMTNEHETRAMWEEQLSYLLREKGYRMFSSVNVDKDKTDLFTREEILALVEEKNIDGVITLRLKDIQTKEKYGSSSRSISDPYDNFHSFFGYVDTFTNVYTWTYQPEQTVTIEAKMFDADTKSVIYNVDASMKNAENQEERVGEMTKSIAKAMAASGHLLKRE